jgi:hypothetical protein
MTPSRALHSLARLSFSTLLALATACASDQMAEGHEPPPPGTGDAPPATAQSESAPVDETATEPEAIEPMVPRVVDLEAALVDEPGPESDEAVPSEDHSVPPAVASDPNDYIFNRLIMKPKKGTLVDKAAVRGLAEQVTGARVADVKAGPRGTFLVVFAPGERPRDKAAQQALVGALRATGNFEYVEADVIMTAR